MYFFRSFLISLQKQTWLAALLCALPVFLYLLTFVKIALNVNYVAYDDILILGVIPGFEDATWLERWHSLTDPFPEHRLVFSRSLVLASYFLFGKVNLLSLMVIGNLCWLGCAGVFYAVFRRMRLSLWHFVPVVWLWFTIHSFENIFWGVSSLCNFGVLLFAMMAFYFISHSQNLLAALLCALAATFTYGNGITVFVIIAFVLWITGRRKAFFLTTALFVLTAFLYFSGFPQKTESLDFSDPEQLWQGLAGFFGFIGAITAFDAYSVDPIPLGMAVVTGLLMAVIFVAIFGKKLPSFFQSLLGRPMQLSPAGQFALALLLFVAISSFAVLYKRIPLGGFESLFKGRYRMYSSLGWVMLHLGALTWLRSQRRQRWTITLVIFGILINLTLLYVNFATAVNNRRAAVVQEFNTRYNSDWLGLRMFQMSQAHFETIRSYYQSDDPLAEGWNPRTATDSLPCVGTYELDSVLRYKDEIHAYAMSDFFDAEESYTDGPYVLLKSATHVYASPPNQFAVPLRTILRRFRYFARGFQGIFHEDTVEPGVYKIYVLMRRNGKNEIYCTNQTWIEPN
ncbi:hypothetical protein [Arundinibacter roseus]|uniref:Glycosyltransferase RgtA/B/C/D-like domain-containing protein n=1 Tax=Arundinibacter roseus TaxID=2070510 RepID=A0A4R4KL16_9BACT|nr:hypothetical protein [Arundinibacter roseus]TDB69010.1 hypothetical protein EZE20_01360 [Arundinibacter roseus]